MQPTAPKAVVDLTEMVRVAMQRLDQSPLIRQWELRASDWVVSAMQGIPYPRGVACRVSGGIVARQVICRWRSHIWRAACCPGGDSGALSF